MSGNPQERYERIALDLTKIIVEQKNMVGDGLRKNEVLQTYIDAYKVVTSQEMPSEES